MQPAIACSATHLVLLARHRLIIAIPAPIPRLLLLLEYASQAHATPHSMNILTVKLHLVFLAAPSFPAAAFVVSTSPLPQFVYHVSLEIILTEAWFSVFLVEMDALIAITELLVDHATLG